MSVAHNHGNWRVGRRHRSGADAPCGDPKHEGIEESLWISSRSLEEGAEELQAQIASDAQFHERAQLEEKPTA